MLVGQVKARIQSAKSEKSRNDPVRLKKRINAMRGEWRKRKETCSDFVEQMADAMEKKVKDVVKLLDVETDQMLGAVMPPKHEI